MNILVRVNREWFWEGELNGDVQIWVLLVRVLTKIRPLPLIQ